MRSFLMQTGHVVVVTDLEVELVALKREYDANPSPRIYKKMMTIARQMMGKSGRITTGRLEAK